MIKEIGVEYFALFFQERGVRSETLTTNANTVAELFCELKAKHRFKLSQESVKVALNAKVVCMDHKIKSGDKVLLIPPIAGG